MTPQEVTESLGFVHVCKRCGDAFLMAKEGDKPDHDAQACPQKADLDINKIMPLVQLLLSADYAEAH